MAPAQVAVALCVPRDQCHPSTPLIRSTFPITVPRAPCDRSYGDDVYGWLDGGGGGGGSLDGARMAQGVSKVLNREPRSLAVIAQYSCRRMRDGARASGGRPVCSARPMPPKHATHQIYFPITVPRAVRSLVRRQRRWRRWRRLARCDQLMQGGAVYNYYGTFTASDCTFDNNVAVTTARHIA